MFAFAIYDTRARTLVLGRDRFGIKPLFYAPASDRFAFASEITALLEVPDIDTRPDRQAIYDFAALFYIPAPETIYTGIRALQPGELVEAQWDGERLNWRSCNYHRWSVAPDLSMTLEDAVDRSEALVTSAVHRQIESDVPIGALLSGGIDSSVISALAHQAKAGIQTFNVRFPEKTFDETWAARAVANHIGSDHTTLDMDASQGSWKQVTALLLHAGQPFADVSFFAVNQICRLMRSSVTVALSGDGGDEVFGGYDIFWRIARIVRWKAWPLAVQRAAALILFPFPMYGGHLRRRMGELTAGDDTSVIQSMFCWLGDHELQVLCRSGGLLPSRRLFEPQWEYHLRSKTDCLERLSAHAMEVSIRLALPNDYLFKVDMASMKESLEVRVPMLDEDLVDFGLHLPHKLKVYGRTCKRVLRRMAQRTLPVAVAKKSKKGFGIPLPIWLDRDFKDGLRDILLAPSSKLPEFFHPAAYKKVVKALCESSSVDVISQQELYRRAIMLLAVQLTLTNTKTAGQTTA